MAGRQSRNGRTLKIVRRGPILAIRDVPPQVVQLLHGPLSYQYKRHLRGVEARQRGRQIEIIPIECYKVVEDNDGLRPPQLITAAGWYPRISRALQAAGWRIEYVDHTPPSPGGERVFQPLWHRLDENEFRWKQREILELIVDNPYGQIICPTGFGKSYTIGCLATLFPYARFVVTTHSADVIQQLYEDLSSQLPSVGLITGSRKITGQRVMCVSGKSLHHAPRDTDFLLVDEVAEFATQDYLQRVTAFTRSRNYGFTANVKGDRNDGADYELEGLFGPPLISLEYQDAVTNDCIVDVRVRWLDMTFSPNPCEGIETSEARERHGIWRNEQRHERIARAAREYRDAQVLIVVSTIEHAVFLKQHLPEFELVYSENGLDPRRRAQYETWGVMSPDEPEMTADRRWKLKKAFERGQLRKVIATGVWNKGVNFKSLQVLIRADAKASPTSDKQIPGRLSRLYKDKSYGLLIDCLDQFDTGYNRKALERRSQYRKLGWRQLEIGEHKQLELFR